MEYKLVDLIDLKKFQKLMEEFYNITKIPHGLLDAEGNILSGIGWHDACTKFHRVNSKSNLRCKESDLAVSNMLCKGKKYELYKCKNGLMEAVVPIKVEGNYMGMLCLGQFLFEKPDIQFFEEQAEEFGYDRGVYMEAVSRIPIFTKEKVDATMAYFFHLADMLSDMGLNQLKQNEAEKLLINANAELEEKVDERTRKLAIANEKLKKDIVRRKLTEYKLKVSQAKYRTLVEIMPDSIIVYNEGYIIYANPAFAKLVGMDKPEKLIGRSMRDFIHPDDRSIARECVKIINDGKTLSLTEQRIMSVGGQCIDIEATGTLFPYEGKTVILAVGRDISERKKAERLQKKIEEEQRMLKETREYDKLKMEFFANLSHEFRTPLNLIYSTVQLLENDLDIKFSINEKLYLYNRIKVLKQNTYRLLRLSNNLLDITKLDSGYFEFKLENRNIVSVVEDITMSVAQYIKSKNIKVLFDTDMEENVIAIDVSSIERIMLNLLSNSVKFTETDGEIMVNLFTTEKHVCISVKDTGIGIPEDKIKIILDRFRQVNKSIRRNHEGSGIGLSLVKRLVDLHSGDIEVKSEYENGSEFIIKLPRTQVNNCESIDDKLNINDIRRNNIEVIDIEFSDIYLLNDIS